MTLIGNITKNSPAYTSRHEGSFAMWSRTDRRGTRDHARYKPNAGKQTRKFEARRVSRRTHPRNA